MNFVCVVFELCDKMLTLSSMENLIVPCNLIPLPMFMSFGMSFIRRDQKMHRNGEAP